MAKWLKEKPLSKDELDVNLQELLGPMWHPRVRGTIAAQLYQARIGDHHNCWLRRDGHKYYLEPKTADNHPKLSAGWWRAL